MTCPSLLVRERVSSLDTIGHGYWEFSLETPGRWRRNQRPINVQIRTCEGIKVCCANLKRNTLRYRIDVLKPALPSRAARRARSAAAGAACG